MLSGQLISACLLVLAATASLPPPASATTELLAPPDGQENGRPSRRQGPLENEQMSESVLVPDDDEETVRLKGKSQAFSDYCISSRELVMRHVNQLLHGLVGSVFNIMLSTAQYIGTKALQANTAAAQRLAASLVDSKQALDVSRASLDDPEVAKIIEDSQLAAAADRAAGKSRDMVRAIVTVLKVTVNVVSKALMQKLSQLYHQLGLDKLGEALMQTCDRVEVLMKELDDDFLKRRESLFKVDSSYKFFTALDVDCVTVSRVRRLKFVCGLARNPLMGLLFGKSRVDAVKELEAATATSAPPSDS